MTSPARNIRLKCRWNETEIRTVAVSSDTCDFSAVKRRLTNDYGFPVSLKCKWKSFSFIRRFFLFTILSLTVYIHKTLTYPSSIIKIMF